MKEKVQPIDKQRMYSAMIGLCLVTILACWIMRLFGYHGFDLDMTNVNLHHIIRKIINGALYVINSFAYLILLYKRKLNKYEVLSVLIVYPILFIMSLFRALLPYVFILECASYVIYALIGIKDKWYKRIIEAVTILLVFAIIELITGITKSLNVWHFEYNFIESIILMVDYYIIKFLLILKFYKGGYVHVQLFIWGRLGWQTFLAVLSKRKRNQESLQQSKENVSQEIGFKFFVVALAIAQFAIVGVLCYFINHVILQYFIVAISFFVIKKVFGKSYHAETIIKCTSLSCAVFVTATRLSLPLSVSILCNIIIGTLVAYMMYVFYYFFKFTSKSGVTLRRGMSKEELDEACKDVHLEEIEYQVLYMYYCEKKKRYIIGNELGYSEDSISKFKKKALDKLV